MSTRTMPWAKRALPASASGAAIAAELHRRLSPYDAAAIAGTNPYQGALALYEEKTAERPPVPTPAQLATADATPRLLRQFRETYPNLSIRRVGLLVPRNGVDWLAARPTALTSDGGLLIITTTREELAHEWFAPHPVRHHRMPERMVTRVLHDLLVTGATHARVMCEIQGLDENVVVHRSLGTHEPTIELSMQSLFDAEQNFWIRHILKREPPAPTRGDYEFLVRRQRLSRPGAIHTATPEQMQALLRRWRLREQKRTLEAQIRGIDAELVAAMGSAERLVPPPDYAPEGQDAADTALIRYEQTRGFAPVAFAREHPDLAAQHSRNELVLDVDSVAAAAPEQASRFFNRPWVPCTSAAALAALDRFDQAHQTTGADHTPVTTPADSEEATTR